VELTIDDLLLTICLNEGRGRKKQLRSKNYELRIIGIAVGDGDLMGVILPQGAQRTKRGGKGN
jgi:hypothetical protein